MASIEFIQNRVAGAEAKVAKLEKKLERILNAKAHDYEDGFNPYCYSDYDLRSTEKELGKAKASLEKYKADLQTEQEKAASRNVKVILDFLEMWKKRVFDYYVDAMPMYKVAKADWYAEDSRYCDWWNRERRNATPEERKKIENAHRQAKKEFASDWNWLTAYVDYRDVLDSEKLRKDLEQESNRKYDFIIERCNEICGQITDAAGLSIGAKDDLNGYVIGTKGTAKVQTIGAGGYNIQCYHFRTLINEMK